MSSYILELRDRALVDIYEDWKGKDRLTLSETKSLVELCELFPSIKYYVDNQLLSYPYDKVDNCDLRDLEYHINYYFDMFYDE